MATGESEEMEEETNPYAGEILGGARASVSPGFDPEPLRFLIYQPAMRILLVFGFIVAVLTASVFYAGYALHGPNRFPGILALLFYTVGVLLTLVGLLDLAFLGMGYSATALYFKNALLSPGIVLPGKPLAVAVLASLSNGSGEEFYGIQRQNVGRSLPFHSNEPGTRVPVVCSFYPAEGLDRWLHFTIELICWGTGDRRKIEQCFERLGAEGFERLEACLAKGYVPKDEDELILLDEDDNKLESLSIKEGKEKFGQASN